MQEKNKNIQPFDTILSAYINKADKNAFSSSQLDKEFEQVFSTDYMQELSDEKANLLINKVYSELSKDTLGTVIDTRIIEQHVDEKSLISETGLTTSLLDDIRNDRIFSNSIPVRSLLRLIKFLGIGLDNALEAIDRTFDRLITESQLEVTLPVKAQPAFRKGATARNEFGFDIHRYKSDEGYLFQNQEALDKYKKRLEELYHKE